MIIQVMVIDKAQFLFFFPVSFSVHQTQQLWSIWLNSFQILVAFLGSQFASLVFGLKRGTQNSPWCFTIPVQSEKKW